MKFLLTAINAKYIHSNLAVYSLRACAGQEKENIEISDKDYKTELDSYLSTYNCKDEDALNEQFQNFYGTDAKQLIMDDLLYKKVKTYLADNVVEK